MKLTDQVINLEFAKQLKELGMEQKSIFVWEYLDENAYGVKYYPYSIVPGVLNNIQLYSAFTASELMDMLPLSVDIKTNEPFNHFRFNMSMFTLVDKVGENGELTLSRNYAINYHCDTYFAEDNYFNTRQLFEHNIFDTNLANALAKTLIKIFEEGYMES